jgi:hypothetical protein
LRREVRARQPLPMTAGEYRIAGGRIVHLRPTPQGLVEVPMCNFGPVLSRRSRATTGGNLHRIRCRGCSCGRPAFAASIREGN